jgi:hypothetical protein
VTSLKRRLRSLLIAFAVLALSAGVAMAGRGTHPTGTAPTAPTGRGDQAGQDEQGGDQAGATESEAPETEAPESETPDATQTDATAPTTPDTAPTDHPDNHGKLVSEAAQTTTVPAGFDNHGAYVKSVATSNSGQAAAAAARTKHAAKPQH